MARLRGRTPNVVYLSLPATRVSKRFEPRPRLLKRTKQHRKGEQRVVPVDNLKLVVEYLEGQRHLPIVGLERAA